MGATRQTFLLLAATLLFAGGCSRIDFDPGQGAETIQLRTIDHVDAVEVTYLRTPEQGPIVFEGNTWTWFWSIPVNRPEVGFWLERELPEGASAANIRATMRTPWWGYVIMIPTLGIARVDRVRFEAQPVVVHFRVPSDESDHSR